MKPVDNDNYLYLHFFRRKGISISIMDIGVTTFCLVDVNSSLLNDVAKPQKLERPKTETLKKRNVLEILGLKVSEISAVRVSIPSRSYISTAGRNLTEYRREYA
jgi:hypothetical protein